MPEEKAFHDRLERIDTLLETLTTASNPAVQAGAAELVQILLELHGSALHRMLEIIWDSGEAGERLIHESLVEDVFVGNLLLLHGLHPLSLEERVYGALEKVRPYLRSHGGDVELQAVADGVVYLRLRGSCEGCPSSAMTLKYAVEDAIFEAAPDVLQVETTGRLDERRAESGFVPLSEVTILNGGEEPTSVGPGDHRWYELENLDSVVPRVLEARRVNGRSVLICRLDDSLYAYDGRCPGCGGTLESAALVDDAIVCPGCDQTYDVVGAGRSAGDGGLHLEPLPLLQEEGRFRLAMAVE